MSRILSIDLFRGIAILGMVLANYLAGALVVPAWLKHAPDAGLTVIDLVAPFFIFAIGLTYGLSARARIEKGGWGAASQHILFRYLALVGLGCVLSAGEILFDIYPGGVNWGVLQGIGVAGLVALPLVRAPGWVRAAAGLALLVAYQAALENGLYPLVLGMPHGGLPGAVAWAAMLLLSTALADLYHAKKKSSFWLASAAALALGLGLAALGVVVSKNRVSASYVLVSLGISGLLFALVAECAAARWFPAKTLLQAWGRNPLLLYLLHLLALGLFYLPPFPVWYSQAPAWLVALQALALVAGLSWAAWKLRNVRFIL
jgi:predicted acyltransferase